MIAPFGFRFVCHKWGETSITWASADWKWSECQLVQHILDYIGVDASQLGKKDERIPPWEDEVKRRQLIRLICRIKGEREYNALREKRQDIKITASDIKMVIKAVANIDVDVKLEDDNV